MAAAAAARVGAAGGLTDAQMPSPSVVMKSPLTAVAQVRGLFMRARKC
jgi:hypothetical protein